MRIKISRYIPTFKELVESHLYTLQTNLIDNLKGFEQGDQIYFCRYSKKFEVIWEDNNRSSKQPLIELAESFIQEFNYADRFHTYPTEYSSTLFFTNGVTSLDVQKQVRIDFLKAITKLINETTNISSIAPFNK